MSYEWELETPCLKEFNITRFTVESYGVEELDSDGNTFIRGATRQVPVNERGELPADRIRLSSIANDEKTERLFIRFFYGYINGDGEWKPARLDDGLVISGPNYKEVDLDLDGEIEEDEVLLMCAKLLGWQGKLVKLLASSSPGEEERA